MRNSKRVMSILLYPNRMKDTDLAVTRQAAQLLKKLGAEILVPEEFGRELEAFSARAMPAHTAFASADQVVTIGGDGTLLRAGTACVRCGKPVLGVNLGRTGFLATCEVAQMPEKLARLVQGNFQIESRNLLNARCDKEHWNRTAINDVVLSGASRLHPMDYAVYCDGAFVSRYRCDGLIFATPTGSTAYSLSAGGPVLDVDAPVLVVTPICAHGMNAIPLVFSASRCLTVVAEPENRDTILACADSHGQCAIQPGDRVEIRVAEEVLKLIAFEGAEQFRAIETKLLRR